jgi:hypothetical protein
MRNNDFEEANQFLKTSLAILGKIDVTISMFTLKKCSSDMLLHDRYEPKSSEKMGKPAPRPVSRVHFATEECVDHKKFPFIRP